MAPPRIPCHQLAFLLRGYPGSQYVRRQALLPRPRIPHRQLAGLTHLQDATPVTPGSCPKLERKFSSATRCQEAITAIGPAVSRQCPEPGQVFREEGSVGGSTFVFETGKLAKLASGAVVVSVGDTAVLATAVGAHEADAARDFLPLQVDYREKQYAAGKIPNTFMRREGAPKEREILCSRVIDRSIRPLFPKGFFFDTQIMANVLSSDGEHDPDILAINAASAALTLSSIPWDGPIGAVRIGRLNGEFVVNPTMTQLASSDLNLVYACTASKALMIETQAREITNEELTAALQLAHSEAKKLIEPQLRLASQVRHTKRVVSNLTPPPEMVEKVRALAVPAMASVLSDPGYGKQARGEALSQVADDVAARLKEEGDSATLAMLPMVIANLKREVVKNAVFAGLPRVDGRDVGSVRQLACEAGLLSPMHGSSLFSRGNTQVLCTVTMGPPDDAQRLDSLVGPSQKRFMVHYSFPGFSINEVKQERGGLNRREVGHGTLAEKALVAMLPSEDDFPYSVRVTSEVLGSDGSSSMATVCGGSLALMDAGIQLREHVAGVSMGLMTELDPETKEVKDYRLLTDILGLEDYLGDMDFKIAGTRRGITAIQLDIKLPGVPLPILCEGLQPALEARCRILDAMEAEIAAPRAEQRDSAPRVATLTVEKEQIGRLIGPQGSTIKNMQKITGARLAVADTGVVTIFARDQASFDAAKEMVEATVGRDIEVGSTYQGTVVAMKEFGAFVELEGGLQGLLHISEIEHTRVARVEDILKLGQTLPVVCIGRDFRGNVKLSRKPLLPPPDSVPTNPSSPGPIPALTLADDPASPPSPPLPSFHTSQSPAPFTASSFQAASSSSSYYASPSSDFSANPGSPGGQSPAPRPASSSALESTSSSWLALDPPRETADSTPPWAARIGAAPSAHRQREYRGGGDGALNLNPKPRERAFGAGRGGGPGGRGRFGFEERGGGGSGEGFRPNMEKASPPWEGSRESEGFRPTWQEEGREGNGGQAGRRGRGGGRGEREGGEDPKAMLRVGQEYSVRVKDVRLFGAVVELAGGSEGLLRFDQDGQQDAAALGLAVGQELRVRCLEAEGGTRPKFALGKS